MDRAPKAAVPRRCRSIRCAECLRWEERPVPAFQGVSRPRVARGAAGRRGRWCQPRRAGSSYDRVPRPRPSATPPDARRSGGLRTGRQEERTCRGRRCEPLRDAPSDGAHSFTFVRRKLQGSNSRDIQVRTKSDAYSGDGHMRSLVLSWRRPTDVANSATRVGFNLWTWTWRALNGLP